MADAPQAARRQTQGNPVAAGLVAFGLGLLIASLIPASRKEEELAQTIKEQAQPLTDQVVGAAKEVAGNLAEPAQQAVENLKESATDAVQTVQAEGEEAVSDVQGLASESAQEVQGRRPASRWRGEGRSGGKPQLPVLTLIRDVVPDHPRPRLHVRTCGHSDAGRRGPSSWWITQP